MYQHILVNIEDNIATVTLNRPEKLNAYIVEMGEEVVDAFESFKNDKEVKVVILTGAGRGFCAGVDLDHLKAQFESDAPQNGPKLGEERFVREFPLELVKFPKPIIVAINGHAIGVGVTMALPCDIRIAAESAKLGLTFTKMGILPGLGSTHLLPNIVGPAKARELILTGKIILAPEAAEIGLVNKCVPDKELMNEARAMAKEIASCSPKAIAAAKCLLTENSELSLEASMQNERSVGAAMRK